MRPQLEGFCKAWAEAVDQAPLTKAERLILDRYDRWLERNGERLHGLAQATLERLAELAQQEETLRGAFGDDQGAHYRGNMRGDLRRLAEAVIARETSEGGPA